MSDPACAQFTGSELDELYSRQIHYCSDDSETGGISSGEEWELDHELNEGFSDSDDDDEM